METVFEYIFWSGLTVLALGAIWFLLILIRGPRKRIWIPALTVILGLGLMGAPAMIDRYIPVDLGARERMIEGKRHITLTGWDGESYRFLVQKPDTFLLQMGNPDVTDQTLELVEEMASREELDLNDSAVTDEGLAHLSELRKLRILRLRGTKITDEGFRTHLFPVESLKRIDVRNTRLSEAAVNEWKAASSGRRANR
ncbi:MAG: hypothetical protein AB8G99_17630 [Planctomycetaceae bacterium]